MRTSLNLITLGKRIRTKANSEWIPENFPTLARSSRREAFVNLLLPQRHVVQFIVEFRTKRGSRLARELTFHLIHV